jgi:hypothetical protein
MVRGPQFDKYCREQLTVIQPLKKFFVLAEPQSLSLHSQNLAISLYFIIFFFIIGGVGLSP